MVLQSVALAFESPASRPSRAHPRARPSVRGSARGSRLGRCDKALGRLECKVRIEFRLWVGRPLCKGQSV